MDSTEFNAVSRGSLPSPQARRGPSLDAKARATMIFWRGYAIRPPSASGGPDVEKHHAGVDQAFKRRARFGFRTRRLSGCCALRALAGCAASSPLASPAEPRVGVASYYDRGFARHRTANGETYDPRRLTAAHRTLPFGTLVRVTNLTNGRQVVVRINDRGPVRGDRLIDVSRRAARGLGMVRTGVTRVRLDIVPDTRDRQRHPLPARLQGADRTGGQAAGALLQGLAGERRGEVSCLIVAAVRL